MPSGLTPNELSCPINRLRRDMESTAPDADKLALDFVDAADAVATANNYGGFFEGRVVAGCKTRPDLIRETLRKWAAADGLVITQNGQAVNF